MKKKLEKAEEATTKAEQEGYEVGVAETEENFRAQVTGVYRGYCLQVWNEALNQAEVDASSTLRRAENAFYPPALQVAGPSSFQAKAVPKTLEPSLVASASALPFSTIPPKEVDQAGAIEKKKEPIKETAPEPTKLPPASKDSSKEKGASLGQELVLVTLPFIAKRDPKGKGTTQTTVPELPAKTAAKANPPPSKTK